MQAVSLRSPGQSLWTPCAAAPPSPRGSGDARGARGGPWGLLGAPSKGSAAGTGHEDGGHRDIRHPPLLGTEEPGVSLAAAGALALREGLEVHGEGQLLGQRRALPLVPCQHVAHHQPEGHQQQPHGVGQDALGHELAVGIPAGTERDARAMGRGWPGPALAGDPLVLILILLEEGGVAPQLGTAPRNVPCPQIQQEVRLLLALTAGRSGGGARSYRPSHGQPSAPPPAELPQPQGGGSWGYPVAVSP